MQDILARLFDHITAADVVGCGIEPEVEQEILGILGTLRESSTDKDERAELLARVAELAASNRELVQLVASHIR